MSPPIEYKVFVSSDLIVWRNSEGELHREDGPAIERANGAKEWWLNNHSWTEAEWKKRVSPPKEPAPCEGKIIEIDGKQYKLTEVA